MPYQLPPEEVLAKYMYLLRSVLLEVRSQTYSRAPDLAGLVDAVENLPDLLMRWRDMDERILLADLQRVETTNPEWKDRFTRILEEGAPRDWQLIWDKPQ